MTPLKPYAVTLHAPKVLPVESCVGTHVGGGDPAKIWERKEWRISIGQSISQMEGKVWEM